MIKNKNMGSVDRIIRLIIAIVFLILIMLGVIKGIGIVVFSIISAFFIFTVIFRYCPMYALVGIHTLRTKSGVDI